VAENQEPIIGTGELRSSRDIVTASLALNRGRSLQVKCSRIEDKLILEGDILVVEPSREAVQRATAIHGDQYRWPRGVIPYTIGPTMPNPQRVTAAIAHWESKTKIRFTLRTAENAAAFPDSVSFEDQGGCFSAVGRRGGKQVISLGPSCTAGNAIHEIGHTVGLWHEQSRKDRDDHVIVHLENVIAATAHNFDQHVTDGDDVGDYDFDSIMHYPKDAFSKNGLPTIVPKINVEIGQRAGLSPGDIAAVAALYPRL
jgi:hypothetical protein